MRKFLLLSAIAVSFQLVNAQANRAPRVSLAKKQIHLQQMRNHDVCTVPAAQNTNTHTGQTSPRNAAGITSYNGHTAKSLANGTPLNSQKIGSAGNLLTITEFNCNQLYAVDPLGLVSFVHRVDNTVITNGFISQYAYDFSANFGQSWTSNVGPITVGTFHNEPIDDNGTDPHGRYPLGAIYNPTGNTTPSNAQQVYSGTWHDAPSSGTTGSWVGQMYGNGGFGAAATAFNVNIDTINGGTTAIATGFCQSVPGTFWAVNENYTGNFTGTVNEITRGVIVEKGVYNTNTQTVDWTSTVLPVTFDSVADGTIAVSMAFSFDIAFDPTGQYGWISCVGDQQSTADSVLEPIFWSSTDGGNTWNGPIQIPIDSLPDVVNNLSPVTLYNTTNGGTPGLLTSGIPTLETEAKLAVDYLGNPHLFCTIGNGGEYDIEEGAGYIMYDITLTPQGCDSTWNGWSAIFVDSVETLTGNTTSDAPVLTEDNRPLISRTSDGTKMFFFWSASDVNIEGADNNAAPNVFARGFDLQHSTSTQTVNLTQGDPLWGGPTVEYPNGGTAQGSLIQGAFYSTISPIAITQNGTYNIPLILTQIDYQNGSDISTNPAQFWYIDNINFSAFDFSNGITATITLNGPDTVYLPLGTSYSDLGASLTYADSACTHPGALHVATNSSGVNSNARGTYYVYYAAEDAGGNDYGNTSRVVIVGTAPVASFVSTLEHGKTVQFTDSSKYNPTLWEWNFGDGTTPAYVSYGATGSTSHIYSNVGTYYVCLTDSNHFGSSNTYCDSVTVLALGINQIDFASTINMFPNPASNLVNITLTGSTPYFTVSVYNVLGEQVLPLNDYPAGTNNVQLNTNTLADGVYFVKIQSQQGNAVKSLTIEHK